MSASSTRGRNPALRQSCTSRAKALITASPIGMDQLPRKGERIRSPGACIGITSREHSELKFADGDD